MNLVSPPDQPVRYLVILEEEVIPDKLPHYSAVHIFAFVQDALDFINSRAYPNEWALFRTVELEEKQVTITKMVVKQ